jgi:HK97 gp10 family phage protein
LSVKWHGQELLEGLREDSAEGLFAGGLFLVEAAKSRIHNVTGDLADSAYVAIEGKSTYKSDKKHYKEVKPRKGGAVAGFSAFYAKMVEFGTPTAGARPFLRPAFDELKEQIGEEIVGTISRKFKKRSKK